MFNKTLLGAAIAAATLVSGAANAYMIGDPNDANVEVYGVVSISAVNYGTDDESYSLENETRVGFRAAKAMTDSVEAFMQVESGWVLDNGADLGNRDTFVGFRGDDWGTVRFGRMLTPMYELVDWPYSASNMGTTFDRGWRSGERFQFDRKSQQLRFDSPMIADMVKFSASVGNGTSNTDDSKFYGGSVSVTPIQMLTLHAAFELGEGNTFDDGKDHALDTNNPVPPSGSLPVIPGYKASVGDTDAYFAGFQIAPMDNFNIAGAYKSGSYTATTVGTGVGKNDYKTRDIDAYSLQANYFFGNANIRVGYAAQTGETDGKTDSYLDRTTITSELGYSFNSVYTFVRVAEQSNDGEGDLMVRLGTEWTF